MTTTVAGSSRITEMEYQISMERLEELNRAATPLLLSRLSTTCPSYGKSPSDIGDPKTLVDEIRRNCANDTEFIRSEMPLQEIVFRTLLLDGGGPMTLGELHHELTERWSTPIRPITVTATGLARILNSDTFYGFEAIPMEEPETEDLPDMVPMLTPGADQYDELLPEIFVALASDDDEEDVVDDEDDDDIEDLFEDDEDAEEE